MIKRTMPLFASVLVLAACSPSKKAGDAQPADKGVWQQQKVIADGNSNDWDKSAMEFDKDSKIAYKITNDETNLYVLVTTADHTSQTKILRAGMSVFIDPAAKKKETIAVNFPIGTGDAQGMGEGQHAAYQPQQQGQPGEKPDMQQMRARALINANQYNLTGFAKGSGGYGIAEANEAGVVVKIDFNQSGEMIYEALIPLQSLTQAHFIAKAGSTISVGLKINALPKPEMGEGHSGGGGGGMGGMGGGGMRGGGMGGGMGGGRGMGGRGGGYGGGNQGGGNYAARQQLFKETKIWKPTIIAQKS